MLDVLYRILVIGRRFEETVLLSPPLFFVSVVSLLGITLSVYVVVYLYLSVIPFIVEHLGLFQFFLGYLCFDTLVLQWKDLNQRRTKAFRRLSLLLDEVLP